MPDNPDVIGQVKKMFPNIADLSKSVASLPGVMADRAIVNTDEALTSAETNAAPTGEAEKVDLLSKGRDALDKIDSGLEDEITPAEERGLEAIILLVGRPALLIQENNFFEPPSEWEVLKEHRTGIKNSLPRVGRIEMKGHHSLDWAGTGFLVGPRTIMTNHHVADEFARNSGDRWSFKPGMSSSVDFVEELGATRSLEFKVEDIIGIHDDLDMALLKVSDATEGGQGLPQPLTVAATPPDPVERRLVYVVGYPAWDGRRNDPEPMRRIFADIYNVKRLQPGQIRALNAGLRTFEHDCSTLGGNSGSPVFDLLSDRILGLHFGGRYLKGNQAVALWMLTNDPLLRKGEVNFG